MDRLLVNMRHLTGPENSVMRLTPTILTFVAIMTAALSTPSPAQADIYRWDNGQTIPDTKEIIREPGINLSNAAVLSRRLFRAFQ